MNQASNEVFHFLEQNRASVQSMEAAKERFARVRVRLDTLVDVLMGSDALLRDRVRATTASQPRHSRLTTVSSSPQSSAYATAPNDRIRDKTTIQ